MLTGQIDSYRAFFRTARALTARHRPTTRPEDGRPGTRVLV